MILDLSWVNLCSQFDLLGILKLGWFHRSVKTHHRNISVLADDVHVTRMVSNTRNVILANRFFGAKIARRSTLIPREQTSLFFSDLHSQWHNRLSTIKVLFEHSETTPGWLTLRFFLRKPGSATWIFLRLKKL